MNVWGSVVGDLFCVGDTGLRCSFGVLRLDECLCEEKWFFKYEGASDVGARLLASHVTQSVSRSR